jgi:Ser/Thr protein kinase RdoA (MazF antagonist)
VHPEPEELDAVRDEVFAALAAWDVDPDAWRVADVVPGSLGSGLRPVVEIAGERYLLRRQPPDLTEEDARFRHALMRHLRMEGLPVPQLRARPGGASYAVVAGDIYELQEWRPGTVYRSDAPDAPALAEMAASALGALHQASATFEGAPHRWPVERSPQAVAEAYVELLRRTSTWDDIGPAVAATAGRVAESAAEHIHAATRALAVLPGPPELHIHGDYQPHNLAFAGGMLTAVYDFDAARWARRLDELAYALICFTGIRDEPDAPTGPLVDDGLDILRAHAFLQAYGRVAPAAEGEAELLGDAMALAFPIVIANGIAEDLVFADDFGGPPLEAEILPRLEWADAFWLWLDRYRGVLAEAWAAGTRTL